jgi:hypothetical protein
MSDSDYATPDSTDLNLSSTPPAYASFLKPTDLDNFCEDFNAHHVVFEFEGI